MKKIAVYRDRLAVQLSDRIIIYETAPVDAAAGGGGAAVPASPGASAGGGGGGGPTTPAGSPPPHALTAVRGPWELQAAAAGIGAASASAPREAASASSSATMMYRFKDRILHSPECSLLVVTHAHVVLCLDRRLSMYAFSGAKEREWVLDSVIRYIKVVGGPPGGEGLLVGLKSGAVLRVYLNNPFPIPLVHHKAAIRCLDMSRSRGKLALVDEHSSLYVYDCASGQAVWSESNAASVAWNAEFEDMLCFSGSGVLSIKTGVFPLHTQKLPGYVVGFTGSKVFSLQATTTVAVDVPQSASMHAYIERGDWEEAYRVACLGVTAGDWRALGERALRALQLGVSRAAFLRAHPLDMRYIELINHFEALQRAAAGGAGAGAAGASSSYGAKEASAPALLAEVLAYGGDYAQAAKAHLEAGTVERALEMFTDLKLWGEARRFAESVGSGRLDVSSLLLKQAQWCEDNGDVAAAGSIYVGLGQASRAVALLGERGLWAALMELVRSLPSAPPSSLLLPPAPVAGAGALGGEPSAAAGEGARARSDSLESAGSMDEAVLAGMEALEGSSGSGGAGGAGGASASGGLPKDPRNALSEAGAYFTRAGLIAAAREVYGKLGDVRALVQLHIDAGQWRAAHALAWETEAGVRRACEAAGASGAPHAVAARLARDLAAAAAIVSHVHLCRGEALAGLDRFEEALKAYEAGGRPDLAARILTDLAGAALEEGRFADASLHYQRLAREAAAALERWCAAAAASAPGGSPAAGAGAASAASASAAAAALHSEAGVAALCAAAARARRFSHYADLYAAYDVIHAATAKPFTMHPPHTVFNAARYLLNATAGAVPAAAAAGSASSSGSAAAAAAAAASLGRLPFRLSLVRTLYALAKTALSLGGYATARRALEPLVGGALLVPPAWRDAVEVMWLQVATAAGGDAAELVVACPRCRALQPSLAVGGSSALAALRPAPLPPSLPAAAPAALLAAAGGKGAAAAAAAAAQRSASPPGAGPAPPAPLDAALGDPGLASFLTPWLCAVSGDACTTCGCPFVRSSITYEVLPLVEFLPTQGTGLVAALTLLAEEAPLELGGGGSGGSSSSSGGQQSIVFGSSGGGSGAGGGGGAGSGDVQFKAAMAAAAERASEARARGEAQPPGAPPSGVTAVPPDVLRLLKPSAVFLIRPPPPSSRGAAGSAKGASAAAASARTSGTITQLCATGGLYPSAAEEHVAPPRLYYNVSGGEVDLVTSAACGRLFHMEDLELAVLTTGQCPFSKAPAAEVGI